MNDLLCKAVELLESDPRYLEDARRFNPVGNCLVGSMLNVFYQVPRRNAEETVRQALQEIDDGRKLEG